MNGFSVRTLLFAWIVAWVLGIGVDRAAIYLDHKVVISKTSAQYAYEPDTSPTNEQITDCQARLETLQELLFRDAAKFGDRLDQSAEDNMSRDNSMFIEGSVLVGQRRPGAFANYCDKAKFVSSYQALQF